MRSPDPVNWTVPLDTGKTFTVTQNVREGKVVVANRKTWGELFLKVSAWVNYSSNEFLSLSGDIGSRPHSEIKAWTPPEVPPPVAQSAPPELSQQAKDQGMSMS